MPFQLTPARAVSALLALTAGVLLAGVVLFTNAEQSRLRTVEGAELVAAASGLAAALEPGADVEAVLDEVVRRESLAGAFFLDTVGRVLAESAGRRLDGIDWGTAIVPAMGSGEADDLVQRSWQGEVYWMAASTTVDGRRVVLLRPVAADQAPVGWVLGIALLLWLLVAAVAAVVLRLGQRPADLLEALAQDLSTSEDVTAMELVQRKFASRPLLGDRARPLFALASELFAARRSARDAQALANAFLQVGSHYVVLCTMGGKVLDANPAFFARTNMMPEWLRGQPLGVLEETLPMEPLMELAERSKRENAAISGVPYAIDIEGTRRAVDVSLRTFPTADEGDVVLIVLADRTKERTLEHQIDQYADTLDLMVDQRVAELTAGQAGLDPLLDAAGAIVATFDRAGETRRFNAGVERLTGRTAFTIRRFDHLAQTLFPEAADRDAFVAWFWGGGRSFQTNVQTPQGARAVHWLRGERHQAGETVERLLLGVVSPTVAPAGAPEAGPAPEASTFDDAELLDPGEAPPGEPGGDGYAFHDEST